MLTKATLPFLLLGLALAASIMILFKQMAAMKTEVAILSQRCAPTFTIEDPEPAPPAEEPAVPDEPAPKPKSILKKKAEAP